MKESRLTSTIIVIVTALLSLFGIVISIMQLAISLKFGVDWYRLIPAVLFLLCFVVLTVYAFSGVIKSKYAFPAVLFSYGLVVLVTGLILPPIFPHGTKFIFMGLAILIIIGLVGFNSFWSNVKWSRIFLTFAYVAEIATAIAALTGNPMAMEGDIVAQASVFIRPIILSTMCVCYLARMYEKAHPKEK